jgi:hypothetical protein
MSNYKTVAPKMQVYRETIRTSFMLANFTPILLSSYENLNIRTIFIEYSLHFFIYIV